MNRRDRRELQRQIDKEQGNPNPVLVGRRIPGVNIGTPASRFEGGVPLDKQVEEVVRQAQAAAEPLPEQAGHVPTIGALATPEGAWGVFCLRCSGEAEEYIYPCLVDPDDWPPRVLVAFSPPPAEV